MNINNYKQSLLFIDEYKKYHIYIYIILKNTNYFSVLNSFVIFFLNL